MSEITSWRRVADPRDNSFLSRATLAHSVDATDAKGEPMNAVAERIALAVLK
ncbi:MULTISPECIES: hypothetical protein [Streptomyces]|uniref:hypothetical protein n=1 Tax=Streptomyces TaxID=1883 RepID=UPI00142F2326|nr:hypothetical protein [Streptomyces galilaeus]